MNLLNLKRGERATVLDILDISDISDISDAKSDSGLRKRLRKLGLIEGTGITCLHKSPLGDPAAYLIRGAVIALRSEDSSRVIIE